MPGPVSLKVLPSNPISTIWCKPAGLLECSVSCLWIYIYIAPMRPIITRQYQHSLSKACQHKVLFAVLLESAHTAEQPIKSMQIVQQILRVIHLMFEMCFLPSQGTMLVSLNLAKMISAPIISVKMQCPSVTGKKCFKWHVINPILVRVLWP